LTDRAERIALVLEGLLPIVALECSDFPSEAEREQCVDVLVMADDLAVSSGGKSRGSLTALAKAIHWLSAIPPGPRVFGRHYVRTNGAASGHRLKGCVGCGAKPRRKRGWREGDDE